MTFGSGSRLTYGAPSGLIAARFALSISDRVMTDHFSGFTECLPWTLVLGICLSFIAGQAVADLRDDRSDLRRLLRRWGRLFEVADLLPEYGIVLGFPLRLRALRPMRGVTILMQVAGAHPRTLEVRKLPDWAKDQEERIQVLSGQPEAIDEGNLYWNPQGREKWPAMWGFAYVVTISVQPRWPFWRQRFRLYVRIPRIDARSAGLTVFQEGRELFDEAALNNPSGDSL